jgi:glycosyltransferase involved in cell wall biosynthesis
MTNDNTDNLYSVSVVIPAYNSAEYICRTIDSVLAQSLPAEEIIVVDDGSSDNTKEIVKKYSGKVNYIYQENGGASVARNTGIEAAKCEWIAFLDADDEWTPDKLKLQIELLQRNPELMWVSGNFIRCLCNEDRKGAMIYQQKAKDMLVDKEYHDEFFVAFTANAAGWTGTMMIKKTALVEAGMFTPGQVMANDIDTWFRVAYLYPKMGFIPEPVATYHMYVPMSITKTFTSMDIRAELLGRHLKLAAEHNRLGAIEPAAAHMVTSWIRALFFHDRPDQIKRLMDEFGELLTVRFKLLTRILMLQPALTAKTCHMISKIVRALNLRKKIISRPQKPKSKTEQI